MRVEPAKVRTPGIGRVRRNFFLVENTDFGTHILELICPARLAIVAFILTSCIDLSIGGVPAAVTVHP